MQSQPRRLISQTVVYNIGKSFWKFIRQINGIFKFENLNEVYEEIVENVFQSNVEKFMNMNNRFFN